jgi:hypothetical protein
MKQHRTLRVCFAIWMVIILTACAVPAAQPTSQPFSAPTEAVEQPTTEQTVQPTATETLLPTATMTKAPTATATLLPTPTETPTITPTAAPLTITPGQYGVGKCETNLIEHGNYQVCVLGVYVTKKHELIFYVSWTLKKLNPIPLIRLSAENTGYIHISDNLGKTYGHFDGGGDAYKNVPVKDGVPITGWLKFPAPQEGAFEFTYHDSYGRIHLGPMSLLVPAVRFIDLSLVHTPYILIVRDDIWKLETQADGTTLVSHTKLPGCTVQEKTYTTPEGKLKSKIEIGSATYEIYGYLLEDQNLGVREYVAVSGLEGMGEDVKPFFVVKIPLDASERCIMDVSDLMAKLSITGAE